MADTMNASTFEAASALCRWPENTSEEYIKARNELLQEEYEMRAKIERVAAMRRSLPQGALMPEYTFDEGPTDLDSTAPPIKVTLADLASDDRTVVLYHFMFAPEDKEPCGMCSMIVDSFNGQGKHLARNINFAIVGKAPLASLRAWAKKRGWNNLRILSSNGTTFNTDMNVEREGGQQPGVSVFKKDGEGVRHVYTAFQSIEPGSERGLDLLAGTYNVLDLTPEGRGNWYASNDYV